MRVKPPKPYKSWLEHAYSQHLQRRKVIGEIRSWEYEAETFKLADRTTYTPDFLVINRDGSKEMHEVKGYSRQAGRIKWKIAAEFNREYRWCWVTRKNTRSPWKLKWYKRAEEY